MLYFNNENRILSKHNGTKNKHDDVHIMDLECPLDDQSTVISSITDTDDSTSSLSLSQNQRNKGGRPKGTTILLQHKLHLYLQKF